MSDKLTANQERILWQLVGGRVPTGLRPERSFDKLEERGLIEKTHGTYREAARQGARPGLIYKITDAGKAALQEAVEKTYNGALRAAKSERNAALRRLGGSP